MGKAKPAPPPPETFKVNPFAGIKVAAPRAATPPPPPVPAPGAKPAAPAPVSDPALRRELLQNAAARHPVIRLRRERKGRGGKEITVLSGFAADALSELMQLLGGLKRELGVGGQVAEQTLELQGDQRQRAADWLTAHGYPTKVE